MKKRRTSSNKQEEQQLYEPEKILEKKRIGNSLKYLVKWKGFKTSEATWETYPNIQHCNWLFEDWEDKINQQELKKIKKMDRIIDKKYENNKVVYLVSLKDGGDDVWVRRKALMVNYADKVSEYEKSDQLVGGKRKFNQKRYSKSQDRFLSSDEDLSNSDSNQSGSDQNQNDSQSDESGSDCSSDGGSRSSSQQSDDEKKNKKGNQRGQVSGRTQGRINNNKKQKKVTKKQQQINDKSDSEDESSDEGDVSESRRIVKTKRQYLKKSKILYDKLPFYGILGIDEPKMIKNMVIDKRVGTQDDGYFACDIVWKIRPNKQQPVDSRVSRKDIKEFYPLILIEFYEYNMTYNGDVVNAGDEDDYEDDNDDNYDQEDDEKYYQRQQKKAGKNSNENENEESDGENQKSDDSLNYQNHIYYGYAKTNEQKKQLKFDEKFFKNNQMEEM